MYVAEHAMAAALLLVAGVLLHRAADRLLVGHLRPAQQDADVVAVAPLLGGDLKADPALAPQRPLIGVGIVTEGHRPVPPPQPRHAGRGVERVGAPTAGDHTRASGPHARGA